MSLIPQQAQTGLIRPGYGNCVLVADDRADHPMAQVLGAVAKSMIGRVLTLEDAKARSSIPAASNADGTLLIAPCNSRKLQRCAQVLVNSVFPALELINKYLCDQGSLLHCY